ncbi:cell division-specific peptidoglycan biosynthesis regulator FtsW [Lentibacillus halodurans]|uniref:Probable peptidoglycan glycosyltransferase FtsW n=1 Tax=Lentibacillus halodurans TaxID=237679 RepID=A0A1I0YYM0_9BACI|nr:putative lipid II flippase FtsW [Lentibacillus halodurans]SFB18381.1 cell division-specific peptidoglycan biosynthesis regulator FtsW [Lentibacillus halodurans]
MIRKLKDYDFTLMITPVLLAAFGIVMIYSASMVLAVVEGYESTHYLVRQIQWFFLAMVGFTLTSAFPYKYYQKLIKIMILIIVVLLIGVLFFGSTANNARSWFDFGPVSLQPAEFAKLGLIIYLASVYSKKQAYINEFNRGVLPPLILTAVILALIVQQPDIGTAAIIFLIACSVIFSSGVRFKHLFILVFVGLALVAFAIPSMITDERISRFAGAFQPFEDPDDDGYHLIQSYLAIGSGGLTGEGLGQSIQKLGFLLEPHTDFIMAVIAEELGFIGVVIVVGMLSIIVLRGLFIARKCSDSFGSLLAIGISSMVGIQAFINLGAISGILPITGVPLPFVSYGGSSLLVMMVAMGIMNNIAKFVKQKEQEPVPANTEDSEMNIYRTRGGKTWERENRSIRF